MLISTPSTHARVMPRRPAKRQLQAGSARRQAENTGAVAKVLADSGRRQRDPRLGNGAQTWLTNELEFGPGQTR